jgi:hypothetical protein
MHHSVAKFVILATLICTSLESTFTTRTRNTLMFVSFSYRHRLSKCDSVLIQSLPLTFLSLHVLDIHFHSSAIFRRNSTHRFIFTSLSLFKIPFNIMRSKFRNTYYLFCQGSRALQTFDWGNWVD